MADYEEYSTEEEIMEQVAPAQIADELEEQTHMRAEDLYGVQTKMFRMTISGTLEELAANPSKSVWKMSEDQQKLLRQVTANKNRSKAGDDARTGDLSKAVILAAEVIQDRNDFPVPIGINMDSIVPNCHDENSPYVWIIEPKTPTEMVNENVFEPNNMFTRYMYKNLEKLDMASLNQQIRFDIDPEKRHALMDPNGYAWRVLIKNVNKGNFPGFEDHMYAIDEQVRNDGLSFGAKVPVEIAREVYDAIKEPIENIESSFTDLRKIEATFERADGESWHSFNNLVGEAAGMDADTKGFLRENALTSTYSATVKMKLSYILY